MTATGSGASQLPCTLPGAPRCSPAGLLLRLLRISSNARSGCPTVPEQSHSLGTESGNRVCHPGTYLGFMYFFFPPYEHFLILMSYSFCLLQLVEGDGQLKHPDILYICKTQSYHLSEGQTRTPHTVLPLPHGEDLNQDDAFKSVARVALLSRTASSCSNRPELPMVPSLVSGVSPQ